MHPGEASVCGCFQRLFHYTTQKARACAYLWRFSKLTACACWQLLRAKHGDSDFEKEWNKKFAWFTSSKECDKITTIHGEKDSLTVLLSFVPALAGTQRAPRLLSQCRPPRRCCRVNCRLPFVALRGSIASLDSDSRPCGCNRTRAVALTQDITPCKARCRRFSCD